MLLAPFYFNCLQERVLQVSQQYIQNCSNNKFWVAFVLSGTAL